MFFPPTNRWAGLAGQPAYGQIPQDGCGFFGCGDASVLSTAGGGALYLAAAPIARANGFSVPFMSGQAGLGSRVVYVNPDGSVGTVFDWSVYPPPVFTGGPQTYPSSIPTAQQEANYQAFVAAHPGVTVTSDYAFVPPPRDAWFQYVLATGAADLAAIQAANVAATIAQSQAGCAATGGTWSGSGCTGGSGGTPPSAYVPPGSVPVSPTATLSFATSRSPSQVGDSWQLSISGAPPNAPVTVAGIHPDGTSATNPMGTSKPDGSFDLTGTFDTTVEGTWHETWYVGGVQVGTPFSFTVAIPGSVAPPTYTPPSPGTVPGGAPLPVSGLPVIPATIFGINSSYVLLGGGALLLLLVAGGRR